MLVYVCLIILYVFEKINGEISDDQYAQMPNLFELDNYDQCMLRSNPLFCTFNFNLSPQSNDSELWHIIKNVSDNPQNYQHNKLRHGICIATHCPQYIQSNLSVATVIERCYIDKYAPNLTGYIDNVNCQPAQTDIDLFDIIYATIIMIYVVFVIMASYYERFYLQTHKITINKAHVIIAAFSIPKNWSRLGSMGYDPDHRKLRAIQGVRFYNMICVILCHTVMISLAGPMSNPQFNENCTKSVQYMLVANGWYAVQTYFVISGWLVAYYCFKMADKFKFRYVIFAIFNRYLRLVPTLLVVLGFHMTWLGQLPRGPYWDQFVGIEYRNCRKNGWTNLLFINNYVNSDNMCLQQTWYIAADMQLFILSTILLYFAVKFNKFNVIVLGVLMPVGVLLPGILAYVNKFDIVVRQYPEYIYHMQHLKLPHWKILYSSGYSNIFGYSIGLYFGYLFHRYRNHNLKFNKFHLTLWWVLTFGLCLSVILVAVIFYQPSFVVTQLNSAIYWALGKNLFALGVAIGIFGFTQRIGWFMRWMCEFRPVTVLGRLTYSVYISHTGIMRARAGYNRYPVSYSFNWMFSQVLADVMYAYLIGSILCLFVEMPISAVQKLFTQQTSGKKQLRKSSDKSFETLEMTSDN